MASLVLPVIRANGTPGAFKLQPVSERNAGEPIGLRVWNGDSVVCMFDHDPDTGTMLLERLDATRPLSSVTDDTAAMLEQVPRAVPALRDPAEQWLVRICASAVTELIGAFGDRLLHWDLHYDNILARLREPWLAIDPNRAPTTPVSTCCRRWTTVGRGGGDRRCGSRGAPPLRFADRGPPAWAGTGRPVGRSAACRRTPCGTSRMARPH